MSARDALKTKMDACQIFTIVPQKLQLVNIDAALLAKRKLHIWIHSSYLVSPWGDRPYNLPFCIKQLKHQLDISGQGVIFHIPKAPALSLVEGLRRLIKSKPKKSRVVLENKAVRPDRFATYETPEKINALVAAFIKGGIPRREIWLCIDTAHLYCSGVRLRDRAAAEDWLARLEYPDRIALFHINGNSSTTAADRHAAAFSPPDLIWGNPKIPFLESGVAAIRDFCRKYNADIIVECDYKTEARYANELINNIKNK